MVWFYNSCLKLNLTINFFQESLNNIKVKAESSILNAEQENCK